MTITTSFYNGNSYGVNDRYTFDDRCDFDDYYTAEDYDRRSAERDGWEQNTWDGKW
jgi:hypothetical protein